MYNSFPDDFSSFLLFVISNYFIIIIIEKAFSSFFFHFWDVVFYGQMLPCPWIIWHITRYFPLQSEDRTERCFSPYLRLQHYWEHNCQMLNNPYWTRNTEHWIEGIHVRTALVPPLYMKYLIILYNIYQ